MIRIETGVNKAIGDLEKFRGKTNKKIESALRKEAKGIVKNIQVTQFSGQRGKKYLDIQTGKAISGWKIRESGTSGNYKIYIYNNTRSPKGFPYVLHHEVTSKRLRLAQAFKKWKTIAGKIIKRAIEAKG